MKKDLHNRSNAVEFYDERYEEGYMEEWDESKKKKVEEIILSLNLPEYGKALDFGCGNGIFTILIKKCLPKWQVFGVEISEVAVQNASKKFPSCTFFSGDKALEYLHHFDFIFSHHVLEHVQDMDETLQQIDNYLKPSSSQLHIFPCGNAGSYEYNLCQLHKDGIETEKGNRFFFEEPGHLRRLQSSELTALFQAKGFELKKQFFANQEYGAVNWITKSSPRFVKKLTDPSNAINIEAASKLKELRNRLLKLTYLQFPYSKYWMLKSKWRKGIKEKFLLAGLFMPAMVSKKTYDHYQQLADKEWDERKSQSNGSEMYLYFKREGA